MQNKATKGNHRIYGTWVALVVCLAFTLPSDRPDPAQKVLDALQSWLQAAAPEKTYLLTDKDIYLTGETIWMSGFVVDGVTHEPGTPSGMLFVDVVDAWGKIWMSPIMKLTYGRGQAQITLPSNLPPGGYQLRAYTARMKSYDEGFQFKRNFQVLNPGKLPHGPSYRRDGNRMLVEFEIANADIEALEGNAAQLVLIDAVSRSEITSVETTITATGAVTAELPIDDRLWASGEPQLVVSWEGERRQQRQSFRVPSLQVEPTLRFFPEGGDWVAGIEARVAFHATGGDGRGVFVRGHIEDEKGEVVTSFESEWHGMGSLSMTPVAGTRYAAVIETGSDQTKRVPLPDVRDAGTTLRLDGDDATGVRVTIRSSEERDDLLVIAHRRGQVVWAAKSNQLSDELLASVPPNRLGAGITHFTVFDADARPLAERLFFNAEGDGAPIQAETAALGSVGKRQLVEASVKLSADGSAAYPNMAVRVTEEAGLDAVSPDFATWLLLASDLRGKVENPGA